MTRIRLTQRSAGLGISRVKRWEGDQVMVFLCVEDLGCTRYYFYYIYLTGDVLAAQATLLVINTELETKPEPFVNHNPLSGSSDSESRKRIHLSLGIPTAPVASCSSSPSVLALRITAQTTGERHASRTRHAQTLATTSVETF